MLLGSPRCHRGAGYLLNAPRQAGLEGKSCLLGCLGVIWPPVGMQGGFSRDLMLGVGTQTAGDPRAGGQPRSLRQIGTAPQTPELPHCQGHGRRGLCSGRRVSTEGSALWPGWKGAPQSVAGPCLFYLPPPPRRRYDVTRGGFGSELSRPASSAPSNCWEQLGAARFLMLHSSHARVPCVLGYF